MKKLFFPIFLVLSLFLGALSVRAQEVPISGDSARLVRDKVENPFDYRQLRLYLFFRDKKSPLAEFSADFIQAADTWGIDWRLLPAIAGLESGYGKRFIPGTFNAYGWGGGKIGFDSWEDSIFHISRKLKEKYYDRGLTTPSDIGLVYAPPNPNWGNLIASIIHKI